MAWLQDRGRLELGLGLGLRRSGLVWGTVLYCLLAGESVEGGWFGLVWFGVVSGECVECGV